MSINLDKKLMLKGLDFLEIASSMPLYPTAQVYDGEYLRHDNPAGSYDAIGVHGIRVNGKADGAIHFAAVVKSTAPTDTFMFFYEPQKGTFSEYQGFGYGYVARSRSGGVETSTSLTGQDWSVDHEFKIRHNTDQSAVRFYIDDTQVAQHTTNISAQPYEVWCVEPNGVAASGYLKYPRGIYMRYAP
jgi:hypothetical protein